jgi:hypothetical protein
VYLGGRSDCKCQALFDRAFNMATVATKADREGRMSQCEDRGLFVCFGGGAYQHCSHEGLLYSHPNGVPSFISRGAAYQAA